MYVVAIHDISSPADFWATAGSADMPAGVTLHSSYPTADGSRATCLWEADSVETVRDLVDGALGQYARNEFYAVDAQHPGAQGLPVGTRASG